MPQYIENSDVTAIIPKEEVARVFESVTKKSVAMSSLTRLPDMMTNQTRLKVLDALPSVNWLESDVSQIETAKAKWGNVYIEAGSLAVIIPISKESLEDSHYDIWGANIRVIEQSIANKIDAAVFLGTGKPSFFPDGILTQAQKKGFSYAQGSSTFFEGVSKGMALIEEQGHNPNGIVGGPSIKKFFRDMVDTTGQIVVGTEVQALPRFVVENGAWDSSKAKYLLGDFSQAVYSVRQDIVVDILKEGVIQNSDGTIAYNLATQNMIALRATFRFGWQLPNPVTALNGNKETLLPFAICVPTAYKIVLTLTPATATTFATSQVVSMAADVASAKIYYTNDGTTPTSASTLYTGPITLTATKTIKAIAIADNYTSSDVATVVYTKS